MIFFIYNLDKEISETIFIYKTQGLGITIFLFFIFYFFVFNYLIFNNYLSFNLINISFNILFIILLGFYIHFCSLKINLYIINIKIVVIIYLYINHNIIYHVYF